MGSVSVVLILLVIVVALASSYPTKEYYDLREAPVLFEKFIKDYNRHYKDVEDKYVHYFAFFMNLIKINKLNQGDGSATFGINQFADYTKEEEKNMFGPQDSNRLY